jgi:hypothetical protein
MTKEKAVARSLVEPVCCDIGYVNIYQRFRGKELTRLIRMIDYFPQAEASEDSQMMMLLAS